MICCPKESLPDINEPLVIVGGNCLITGFDIDGEDRYWTMSGDNVQSLSFLDYDQDGVDELVAGSDDFQIRVFKGEEIVKEIQEKQKVIILERISEQLLGYSLSNGAYGVYNMGKRLWKSRSKDLVTAMCGANEDVFGDKQKVLVIGFESGQIEVRKHLGEVVFQTRIPDSGAISQLFFYDYRMSGSSQVIAVTSKGIIQGYQLTPNLKQFNQTDDAEKQEVSEQQLELNKRKIELQNKIE